MDFSGSGKSEGNFVTLGINEENDLNYAIGFLDEVFTFKEYAIWGRSMGAVTALLYQINASKHPIRSGKVIMNYFIFRLDP
jgi:alpha/beta superfamily hydrolase